MRLNRSDFVLKHCQHEKHNSAAKKERKTTQNTTERRYSALFFKSRKKNTDRVFPSESWKSFQFRLKFFCYSDTWLCTKLNTHSFFSPLPISTEDLFASRVNLWYLVGRVQIKRKKAIMSDEMDECACYWSHEFAMRRLLALVSVCIWIIDWFGGWQEC